MFQTVKLIYWNNFGNREKFLIEIHFERNLTKLSMLQSTKIVGMQNYFEKKLSVFHMWIAIYSAVSNCRTGTPLFLGIKF